MNWKEILKKTAPALATALGGPLAGAGTKFLADKLLGDSEASDSDIAAYIEQATPEQLAKLKELDYQFLLEMKKQGIELFKAESAEKNSARNREIELARLGKSDATTSRLAYLQNFGFYLMSAIILYLVHEGEIDSTEATLIGMILGYAISEAKTANAYYFGKSSNTDNNQKPQ